ncbi:MAG: hypothetical protein ABID64_00950 [Nitrospirota bacterium]
MHTFYITGGAVEDRLEYITHICNELGVRSYDTHRLIPKEQSLTIGIADIRTWQRELFLTPLTSPYTIGIIPNAQLLTIEAQNALLKTLEEPPTHTKIYIESQSSSSLLPTILSRCQIIQLATKPVTSHDSTILQLCDENLSIGKKISLLDEQISNKEEAKVWVTQAIHTLHTNRKTLSTTTYVHFMQHLLTASQHLSANVSYKLAIDQIILQ